jgi:hypothetical protein
VKSVRNMRVCRANLFLISYSVLLPLGFFAAAMPIVYRHRDWQSIGEKSIVAVLFAAWLVWTAYLAVLRVELNDNHIKYRTLFKGEQLIYLNEISSVVHEKHEGSETTTYVLIVTPRLATGKPPITIRLFFLGLRAGAELPALLSAKERDSKDLLTLTMR